MAWLYKRPDSERYWIGWRANGKQHLKSTGTSDRVKAEAQLREIELLEHARVAGRLTDEFIASLTGGPAGGGPSLKAALTDWVREGSGTIASTTLEIYTNVSNALCGHIKATDDSPLLREVKTDQLKRFLSEKRGTVSAVTANNYRGILNVFFNWAMRNELIVRNPMIPVRAFKLDKKEGINRRAFTLEEVRKLHKNAPDDFWRFMIVGGFYTGLRLGDLAAMQACSVDLKGKTISITTIKTNQTIHIPIASPFHKLLAKRLGELSGNKSDYLWPKQAKAYLKKKNALGKEFKNRVLIPAGLMIGKALPGKRKYSELSFHSLRHTNVTFLKMTGANNAVARAITGHSSDAMSEIYTHLPIETLANAINQLPKI